MHSSLLIHTHSFSNKISSMPSLLTVILHHSQGLAGQVTSHMEDAQNNTSRKRHDHFHTWATLLTSYSSRMYFLIADNSLSTDLTSIFRLQSILQSRKYISTIIELTASRFHFFLLVHYSFCQMSGDNSRNHRLHHILQTYQSY